MDKIGDAAKRIKARLGIGVRESDLQKAGSGLKKGFAGAGENRQVFRAKRGAYPISGNAKTVVLWQAREFVAGRIFWRGKGARRKIGKDGHSDWR